MEYHIRRGAYLVGHGSAPSLDSIYLLPEGCTLHEGAPPPEAMSRPNDGEVWRFNMETLAWEMVPPSEEILWARVRYKRDKLLTETDWLTVRALETGDEVPQEWLDYRQALRDVTLQPDPSNIVWPQAPHEAASAGDGQKALRSAMSLRAAGVQR